MSLRLGRDRLSLVWDDFFMISNFMPYSHLKMWFRVRALYLILLKEDSLSEEVRDEGG